MAPTLLWIGLGNMGRASLISILRMGFIDAPPKNPNCLLRKFETVPLLVYNRSSKKAVEYAAKAPADKMRAVESLEAGTIQADIIFTCVADDQAVRELYKAMLGVNVQGKLFIDCSTIHPACSEQVAAEATAAGADFVAAPVFGAPAAADAGQLIAVLAGPKLSVQKAKPWFTGVMARTEIDLSDQPHGKALTLKVLGNTFIFNMIEQLAEAHVVAEKTGLGTEVLHQFVSDLFPGPYAAYSTRMLTGDYHKRGTPLFAIDLARKDARHARDLASYAGVDMQTLEIADAHFAKVQEHCGENGDVAAIYGAVRAEAGLTFENNK